jgi:hypothetical protein
MKRPWMVAVLGLVFAAGGFGAFYRGRTAADRQLEAQCGPELAWMKKEFRLSGAEFERVRVLHEAYKPRCAELCRQVDEQHRHLARLLQTAHDVTPEIEGVLTRAGRIRQQCQTEMLKHFFQVSQAMPPEQGRRYLAWMQAETLMPTHASMLPKGGTTTGHDPSHHH